MNHLFWRHGIAVGLLLGFTLSGRETLAQRIPPPPGLPSPRLFVVQPNGGQAGKSVEITLTGIDLDNPQDLLFSHPGFSAELLPSEEPKPNSDQAKGKRRGMQRGGPPRESQRYRVTIPADAPLGTHDVRFVNKWGVSNPRAFVVGDLAETHETEPNNDVNEAQKVAIESTISGAIESQTDVDDFVFTGRKGQRVVISGLSSSIDSRLLLSLELRDASGKLLGSNHEYSGNDALLDVDLPADGDYLLRVSAFTYTQGDDEHFYRISITTAPWIDAVFPPVFEPGKSAEVTVYGRNLPGGRADSSAVVEGRTLETLRTTVKAPDDPQTLAYRGHLSPSAAGLDAFELRVKNDSGTSNPYRMTLAKAPVVLDQGKNDTFDTAQSIVPPCEIAGRIEARRDRDWYAFEAKKGDVLSIEGYAERIGSPIDLYFALRNAQTKQIMGEYDDIIEPNNNQARMQGRRQFYERTEDPGRIRFVAPSDGRYELLVSSREAPNQASPRGLYRVRITPEQPDFRLILMPASPDYPAGCVLRQGGEVEASVFVVRQDGFNGAITLSADQLPNGVSCRPQVVGTGERQGTLVLSASADAPAWTGTIKVKGTATINGQAVTRQARAATVTWPVQQQSNIPLISRLDHDFIFAVRDKAPFRLEAGLSELTLVQGEKASVPLKLTALRDDLKTGLQNVTTAVAIPNLNANASLPKPGEAKVEVSTTTNTPPGVHTLVWRGQAQVPFNKDPQAKQKPNVPVTISSTPVTLTIVPKELARLNLNPGNVSAKVGQTAELTVRVNRLFEYAGPFRVEVVLPDNVKGVQKAEGEIPAGQDETKLALKIDPDAQPGNRTNLAVRITAEFVEKHPTTQETKFSVNVNK